MAKTILFIEDEAGLQKALLAKLESDGFNVVSALDGEIGLRIAEEKTPDVIILDLILPKKSGFEVLRELKSKPELASIPVIILTNLENNADIERALSLGATTYLVKANYSLEEVASKIKQVIR